MDLCLKTPKTAALSTCSGAKERKKERKKDERKEERLRHKFVEVNIALHEERRPLRYGNHYGNVAKDKTCKLDIRQRTADVN